MGVQLWAEALRSAEIRTLVRRGLAGPRRAISAAALRSQRRGELPPDVRPDALARVCVALFHGLVLQQAWDERLDVGECSAVLEAVLEGARRPPRRARAAGTARPRRSAPTQPAR